MRSFFWCFQHFLSNQTVFSWACMYWLIQDLFGGTMPCQGIQSWTFIGLVAAFLDLSTTFFLLCASTLAYISSKFLGLFGLSLPCPCNGLLVGDPSSNNCWKKVLAGSPSKRISSVQRSVNSRFPFDSVWDRNLNSRLIKSVYERNPENGYIGLEGEESCSSSQEKGRENGRGICKSGKKENRNGVFRRKVRCNIRQRRKGAADGGKLSSTLSFKQLQSDEEGLPLSPPARVNKMVSDSDGGSKVHVISGGDTLPYGGKALVDIGLPGKISYCCESDGLANENEATGKEPPRDDNFECNSRVELCVGGNTNKMIKILEQALEREHSSCATLYLELEKERSAAATAADEAMTMILRLQEEKASIEMEARQYQRMMEEKSAYDFEEMSILKEILLRREREKHFLEKEVEVYRQMIFESDKLDSDAQVMEATHGQRATSLLHSFEDPALSLQRTSKSTRKEEEVQNASKLLDHEVRSVDSQNCTIAFGQELAILELNECESLNQGYVHSPQSIPKVHKQLSSGNEETNEEFQEKKIVSLDNNELVQERTVQKLDLKSKSSLPTTRSYSGTASGFPPMGCSKSKAKLPDLRRNSMSAVDYERFKIDDEVGWLRERLRIVQEGREKLSTSMGNREKEKVQLPLSENVVSQLQGIQKLTESGKAVRQASLPLASCKEMLKKRRWRSVSSGVHRSC